MHLRSPSDKEILSGLIILALISGLIGFGLPKLFATKSFKTSSPVAPTIEINTINGILDTTYIYEKATFRKFKK